MKLALGIGEEKKEGYTGVDIRKTNACDIQHDLNIFPYPFEDNSITEIIAEDIIEHLDSIIKVMEELHRIMKKGGKLSIRTPFWKAENSFTDPTHKWHLTLKSFDYFDPEEDFGKKYSYYSKAKFKILDKKLDADENMRFVLVKL